MNKQIWRPALWLLIYTVLLLSLLTPIREITVHFLGVPLLVAYMNRPGKSFVLFYLITWIPLLFMPLGIGLFLACLSLFFLFPVILMGRSYRQNHPAKAVLRTGFVTFLAELLLLLTVPSLLGYKVMDELRNSMDFIYKSLPDALKTGIPEASFEHAINLMIELIPFYLIILSLWFTFIIHSIGRRIVNRMGGNLPGLAALKDWRLPKSLVFFYVVTLILELLPNPGSFLHQIIVNSLPLLMMIFAIQGLSFLLYLANLYRWKKFVVVAVAVVGVFILPVISTLLSLLGVFDTAFPIRDRLKKK